MAKHRRQTSAQNNYKMEDADRHLMAGAITSKVCRALRRRRCQHGSPDSLRNYHLPPDVKAIADSFSERVKHANRIWLYTATLSLIALGVDGQNGGMKIPSTDVKVDPSVFYPMFVALLSSLYVAFCAAHAHAIQAWRLYDDEIVNSVDKSKWSLARGLYLPAIYNVNTLGTFIKPEFLSKCFKIFLKTLTGAVYFLLPAAANLHCACKTDWDYPYRIGLFLFVVFLTATCCGPLIIQELKNSAKDF